ncbi:PqiB family protein [Roseicella aquatilis]|uniref:MCE family protein n=1 Tax=Roseicella aquatilis TaxID=2527868 RepID=A0A4R4DBD4_9PROT|nr:MlaD family protein [Roseicella aquatilis]TCZ57217.1 MCE family protein [Roseicella aquatilis]
MDTPHPEAVIRARTGTRRGRFSPIWLIPLLALGIAGTLVWHSYTQRGPTITLTFRSAEGLTAGQSRVRLHEVDVGTVETIALTQDHAQVVLTVRMNREAAPLLARGTRFWVVRPRLFAGSLSGLGTLISGSYIQMAPARHPGEAERHFKGLEEPPVLDSDEPGRTVRLQADRLGSISLGSPVFFRDLSVGQVLGWDIGDMAESVTIHAFVRAPYDKYIREGTRFWNASGVAVNLGAQGVQLQLESLRALLLGGIAFETPEEARKGAEVAQDRVFSLHPSQEAASAAAFHTRVPMVSTFTESVSGLAAGAPVTFQGVRIGQVTGVSLEYDPETDRPRIPVRYEIEPERIAGLDAAASRGPQETARVLVGQGLRARLASANLLTGQQQVALDFVTDAAPAEVRMDAGAIVMPSAPGQFAGILESVNQVLSKLHALPLQQIGDNLNDTLAGAKAAVGGPELQAAIASLQATLGATEAMTRRIDAATAPTLKALPPLLASLQATVTQAGRLVGSVDRGYGNDSQFQRDLERTLEQLNGAARALRSLADTLNRNPESLIRGRATGGSP